MMTMHQTDAALASVAERIDAINAAKGTRMEYTRDETNLLEDLVVEAERLKAHKQALSLEARRASAAREASPLQLPTPANNWSRVTQPHVTGGTLASERASDQGFGTFGNFLNQVKRSALGGGTDQRLLASVSTFGGEQVGPDGGFAVPPQWASQISQIVMGEESLAARFSPIVTGSNQVIVPVDETKPDGTTGIIAEWVGEGGTMTDRKPVLKQLTVNLFKVGALAHLSDELMADAPAVHQHVLGKFADALAGKVNEALVAGTGIGQPLGLKNAPGKVTQAKSTSGTTSLQARDVLNMLSRLPSGAQRNAWWLCHNTVLPEIHSLTFGTAAVPLFQPDFRASPSGQLLGLPIVTSEYCQSVNAAAGDLYLVSPAGYVLAVHSAGIQTAASIHFAFNQGLQSFRVTMRLGGTPLASAPISRKNGTVTQSHIVDLAVRS